MASRGTAAIRQAASQPSRPGTDWSAAHGLHSAPHQHHHRSHHHHRRLHYVTGSTDADMDHFDIHIVGVVAVLVVVAYLQNGDPMENVMMLRNVGS